jgi:hypothetical protein
LGQRVVDAVESGASRREGQREAGVLLYFTNPNDFDEAKLANREGKTNPLHGCALPLARHVT